MPNKESGFITKIDNSKIFIDNNPSGLSYSKEHSFNVGDHISYIRNKGNLRSIEYFTKKINIDKNNKTLINCVEDKNAINNEMLDNTEIKYELTNDFLLYIEQKDFDYRMSLKDKSEKLEIIISREFGSIPANSISKSQVYIFREKLNDSLNAKKDSLDIFIKEQIKRGISAEFYKSIEKILDEKSEILKPLNIELTDINFRIYLYAVILKYIRYNKALAKITKNEGENDGL